MPTFADFPLPEALQTQLTEASFTTPTPIQAEAIPLALDGQDILGSAQTGTGKTLAFSIPLIAHLLANPKSKALVITPTRELALQVMKAIQVILDTSLQGKNVCIIGGDPIFRQIQKLRNRPRIIVGTPGRLNDHLNRGTLLLDKVDFLVLDETDRMLDMGFSIQIEQIVKHLSEKRQTLLFSATLPKAIMRTVDAYLTNPVRVAVGSTSQPAKQIQQETTFLKEEEKHATLCKELHAREGSVIVFVKTKRLAERIAYKLQDEDFQAEVMHGDLQQNKRSRVIRNFRNHQFRILVATDIAARGLDVPHVEHVINHNLPQSPEDYIHRIGRTARAGNSGAALNLVSPAEKHLWNAIQRLIDPDFRPEKPKSSGHSRRNKGAPKRFSKPANAGNGNKRHQGKKPQAKGQKTTHTARRKPSRKPAVTN